MTSHWNDWVIDRTGFPVRPDGYVVDYPAGKLNASYRELFPGRPNDFGIATPASGDNIARLRQLRKAAQ